MWNGDESLHSFLCKKEIDEDDSMQKDENFTQSTTEEKECKTTPHKPSKNQFINFKQLLTTVTCSKMSSIEFLQQHGVLARSMLCPGPMLKRRRVQHCGLPMKMKPINDRHDQYTWRCRKVHKYMVDGLLKTCKDVKVSIREGSWIMDSNLSLELIIELIYLWSQGFSYKQIAHELKISKPTIIEWGSYFRDSCVTVVMDGSATIGGPGIEVEIDESKFGKRKYYRGKRVDGQWVFGGRETKDKTKLFMVPVNNRKKPTLLPLIKKWILPGSIIHSDCFKGYQCLPKHGYKHLSVNHSKQFVNPVTGACTNRIESDWRHAKVSLPKYGAHKGMHAGYLGEFMWRRKNFYNDKFITLIHDLNEVFKQTEITFNSKK